MNFLSKLNEHIALWIIDQLGKMHTFWLFCAIATLPILFPPALTVCMYISSAYLQLVLLSVLQAGTRITGERIEKRASEEFALIKAELGELKAMHVELQKLLNKTGK